MKKPIFLKSFIIITFVVYASQGFCWWPFDEKKENKIEKLISDYRKFEKSNDYEYKMLKKVETVVKKEGKKNFTLEWHICG